MGSRACLSTGHSSLCSIQVLRQLMWKRWLHGVLTILTYQLACSEFYSGATSELVMEVSCASSGSSPSDSRQIGHSSIVSIIDRFTIDVSIRLKFLGMKKFGIKNLFLYLA